MSKSQFAPTLSTACLECQLRRLRRWDDKNCGKFECERVLLYRVGRSVTRACVRMRVYCAASVRLVYACARAMLTGLCGWAGVSEHTRTRAPPPIAGPADVSGVRALWRLAGR
jgi:hypothetical protein